MVVQKEYRKEQLTLRPAFPDHASALVAPGSEFSFSPASAVSENGLLVLRNDSFWLLYN